MLNGSPICEFPIQIRKLISFQRLILRDKGASVMEIYEHVSRGLDHFRGVDRSQEKRATAVELGINSAAIETGKPTILNMWTLTNVPLPKGPSIPQN